MGKLKRITPQQLLSVLPKQPIDPKLEKQLHGLINQEALIQFTTFFPNEEITVEKVTVSAVTSHYTYDDGKQKIKKPRSRRMQAKEQKRLANVILNEYLEAA